MNLLICKIAILMISVRPYRVVFVFFFFKVIWNWQTDQNFCQTIWMRFHNIWNCELYVQSCINLKCELIFIKCPWEGDLIKHIIEKTPCLCLSLYSLKWAKRFLLDYLLFMWSCFTRSWKVKDAKSKTYEDKKYDKVWIKSPYEFPLLSLSSRELCYYLCIQLHFPEKHRN